MNLNQLQRFYCQVLQDTFPSIKCAFAYGSAVFQQHGLQIGKVLDLVFVVDHPESWHNENVKQNYYHYSFLRHFGSSAVSSIQRAPAGVYYNTLIKIDSQMLKYGVIGMEDLLQDLLMWKWLYISGRLHKPVSFLTDINEVPVLQEALHQNLFSALYCAVMLMEGGRPFTSKELFTKVVGISYKGDFRMVLGEDKNKVHNIVCANLDGLKKLYSPYLPLVVDFPFDDENCMIKKSEICLESFRKYIPVSVQERLHNGYSLDAAIRSIVMRSSIRQSLKGMMTAGVKKTILYSYEKMTKMIKSML